MAVKFRQHIIDFFQPSFWAGMITILKASAHLILLKYVAINYGASLVGIVGQTMGIAAILQNFAGGGITNGVIRNFSLHFEDTEKREKFISGSLSYGLTFCALMLLTCLIFPKSLALLAYGRNDLSWVFLLVGALSLFSFVGSFIQSILTAQSLVRRIFITQFTAWAFTVPTFIYLTKKFQVEGAISGVLAITFFQAIFFILPLRKQVWLPNLKITFHASKRVTRILFPFTLVTLVTGLVGPAVFILLRTQIEASLGWEVVGHWQALLKISEVCFSFFSMAIASTYFPNVSKAASQHEGLHETKLFLFRFMPVLLIFFLALGATGKFVLATVFSSEFSHLESNLRILLCGDFFRAIGWVFSYFLMARNRLYSLVGYEALMSVLLYFLCRYGLHDGLAGLIHMQALHSIIYAAGLFSLILHMSFSESGH